jgi:2,5-diamino-6-(ribosylamino)-4(3H)-pyrimidinone 5'-phosphate reductase
MVEGGARVIESFLAHPSVVSRVVVTIAPVFVGQSGVGYATLSQVGRRRVHVSQS